MNEILSSYKLKTRFPENVPLGLAFGSIFMEFAEEGASEKRVSKLTKALGIKPREGLTFFQICYESKINADILLTDAGPSDSGLLEKELAEYNLQGVIINNRELDPVTLSLTAMAALTCRFPQQKIDAISHAFGIAPAAFRSQLGVAERFLEAVHATRIPKVLAFIETESLLPVGGGAAAAIRKPAVPDQPAKPAAKEIEQVPAVPPTQPAVKPVMKVEAENTKKLAIENLNKELEGVLLGFDRDWKRMDQKDLGKIDPFLANAKGAFENWKARSAGFKVSSEPETALARERLNILTGAMEKRLGVVAAELEKILSAQEAALRRQAEEKKRAEEENEALTRQREEAERKTVEAKEAAEKAREEASRKEQANAGTGEPVNADLDLIQQKRASLQEQLMQVQENLKAADEALKRAEEERKKRDLEAAEISRVSDALEKETGRLGLAWKRVDRDDMAEVVKFIAEMESAEARFKAQQAGLSQADAANVVSERKRLNVSSGNMRKFLEECYAVKEKIVRAKEDESRRRQEAEGKLKDLKGKIDSWKGGDSKSLEVLVGELKAGMIYLEGNLRILSDRKKELGSVSEGMKKLEREMEGMKAREEKETGEWEKSESLLKSLNEEMNGLLARVKAGGNAEDRESLGKNLAAAAAKVMSESAKMTNSTGSQRIEANRKAVAAVAAKLDESRQLLAVELTKEKLKRGEERAAEELLGAVQRGNENWKGKVESVKAGNAEEMRATLAGLAGEQKKWAGDLLALKNDSGSEKVEVVKGEIVNGVKKLGSMEGELRAALAAKELYEKEQALRKQEEEKRRRDEVSGKLKTLKDRSDSWQEGASPALETLIGEVRAGLTGLEGSLGILPGGKTEFENISAKVKMLEKELEGIKVKEAKEYAEWEKSEKLVKDLAEEVNGLLARVKTGRGLEEMESFKTELEAEAMKAQGLAATVVNSTGSERIESNRNAVVAMAAKLKESRQSLEAEMEKEKRKGEEERLAEGLLGTVTGAHENWKTKIPAVKTGSSEGMRAALAEMSGARKTWEGELSGLKNQSGSEKVEAVKTAVGAALKDMALVEGDLSGAVQTRERYEKEIQDKSLALETEAKSRYEEGMMKLNRVSLKDAPAMEGLIKELADLEMGLGGKLGELKAFGTDPVIGQKIEAVKLWAEEVKREREELAAKFEAYKKEIELERQKQEALMKKQQEDAAKRAVVQARLHELMGKLGAWTGGDNESLEAVIGELKAGLLSLEDDLAVLPEGDKELEAVREGVKRLEAELAARKEKVVKESEEWAKSESEVMSLIDTVNGLLERVHAGGSVEDAGKLGKEFESEIVNGKNRIAMLANSAGSERIEGNRRTMQELVARLEQSRLSLGENMKAVRQKQEEERAADELLGAVKETYESWKGKVQAAKAGNTEGLRAALAGLSAGLKTRKDEFSRLKNDSGSARVSALKGEAGNVLKQFEAAEGELSKALEERETYEKKLEVEKQADLKRRQDESKKLKEEMLQYKNEVRQKAVSLGGASTEDLAHWIQGVNAKIIEFSDRRKTVSAPGFAITGFDGVIAELTAEKDKFLSAHKGRAALENWQKDALRLLAEVNQKSVAADDVLKSAAVDQAEIIKQSETELSSALEDFTRRAGELAVNRPASIPEAKGKELLDAVAALKAKREQLTNIGQAYEKQILDDRGEAVQLLAEASRVYGDLRAELEKGLEIMKGGTPNAVNPAVLLAQAGEGKKLAQQWEKDAQGLMDSKDPKVSEIRQEIQGLAQALNAKTAAVLEALAGFKKQMDEAQSQSVRETEEKEAQAVFERFNREYFRIQELRGTVNMKDPDELERFLRDIRGMNESVAQEMQKLPNQSNSQVITALKDQLSSLLQEIQNRDKELTFVVSALKDARNQQLEEQRLAKQLYIKVEDRLAEIDPLISTLDTRKIDDLDRFSKIISSQRVIYLEEMKKLTNASNSVVVSFLLEKLQQMLDQMSEYENRIAKRRETLSASV